MLGRGDVPPRLAASSCHDRPWVPGTAPKGRHLAVLLTETSSTQHACRVPWITIPSFSGSRRAIKRRCAGDIRFTPPRRRRLKLMRGVIPIPLQPQRRSEIATGAGTIPEREPVTCRAGSVVASPMNGVGWLRSVHAGPFGLSRIGPQSQHMKPSDPEIRPHLPVAAARAEDLLVDRPP